MGVTGMVLAEEKSVEWHRFRPLFLDDATLAYPKQGGSSIGSAEAIIVPALVFLASVLAFELFIERRRGPGGLLVWFAWC